MNMNTLKFKYLILIFILALSGCRGNHIKPGHLSENYIDKSDVFSQPVTEEDILRIRKENAENSQSPQLRNILSRVEESYLFAQNHKALQYIKDKNFDQAEIIFQNLIELFPNQSIGQKGLQKVLIRKKLLSQLELAHDYLEQKNYNMARSIAQDILLIHPNSTNAYVLLQTIEEQEQSATLAQSKIKLNERFETLIDLNFRRASLDAIIQSMASSLNLNIVFDESVDITQEISVFLKQTSIIDALTILAKANSLYIRPIDKNTVMIISEYAPENKKNDISIASFQIVHTSATEMAAQLSGIIGIDDTYIDEKLNVIIVRTSPEKISLARRLIALKDIPEPMVMLELEILEVSRNQSVLQGLQSPTQFSFTPTSGNDNINVETIKNLNSDNLELSPLPYLGLQFSDSSAATKLLANPRMKILNNETGSINIGDRLPLVSAETNNGVTSEKINFVNVGIILSFTPKILPNGEIVLAVNLEVSSVNDTISTETSTTYQIGTRSFTTKLRARNGETQVLGGLLKDEDRNSYTGFPIFFTSKDGNRQQTEIILSITPRLFDHQVFSKEDNNALFNDISKIRKNATDSFNSPPDEPIINDTSQEILHDATVSFEINGPTTWDGFTPLIVTLYSHSNISDISGGAIIEFKRKNLFANIEVIPIEPTNIIQNKVNISEGTIHVVVDNIATGRQSLAVLKASPKFRVLEKVQFKLKKSVAETIDNQPIDTENGESWSIIPQ